MGIFNIPQKTKCHTCGLIKIIKIALNIQSGKHNVNFRINNF
ncbi:hypothetical protein TRIP_D440440 [uncultured Paludibacter sp.]|nr:hypothetical protein TRIP_D440440 [uncultured Paludibacter sp.]